MKKARQALHVISVPQLAEQAGRSAIENSLVTIVLSLAMVCIFTLYC